MCSFMLLKYNIKVFMVANVFSSHCFPTRKYFVQLLTIISVKYYECESVYILHVLVTRHANLLFTVLYYIVICGLPGCTIFLETSIGGGGDSSGSDVPVFAGLGRVDAPGDIEPALATCTHLVYGFAVIDGGNYKLVPLDEYQELDSGKGYYRTVTSLKKRYPGLNILLSVGGLADPVKEKYLTLLESEDGRKEFVNSARTLLRQYAFDGLDLAWEFPEIYVKKDRSTLGSIWHGFKKTFGLASSHKDEKAEEHRDGFTALIRELKHSFRPDSLLLTTTVLPNVDPSIYYDLHDIVSNLDFINILAFNYTTPERKPDEADYPAALYQAGNRDTNHTIDGTIRWWLEKGVPANKVILGIGTFGVTWKLTSDSKISGVPPIEAEGPGEAGPQTKTAGLLSYPEVCSLLPNSNANSQSSHLLRRVTDPSHKLGSYAFRLPDSNSNSGLWVAYEDPDTAGYKGSYAKNKGLGGIAVWDISLDDFRGVCTGERFSILKAARNHL